MKRGKACTMAKVKYITSANEIPAGQKCLLVMYGQEYAQTRHDFGLTITVARQQSKTVSELSFLTAVHTARQARGNIRDFCLHRYNTAYSDYSSSAGWPYFAGVSMTTPPATAAEAPVSPCDATIRRPQRLSSGLDHRNRIGHVHAVGMKTKR
jgi:hypothetical protein